MPGKRHKVLALDLGGTKILAGVVDKNGKILQEVKQNILLQKGKNAVIEQIVDISSTLLRNHPEIRTVGIASAGPLDPSTGVLLDPTNFISKDSSTWSVVPIVSVLKKKLKKNVILENDAAAAALAEKWLGKTKNCQNSVVVALGTGLGVGVITNGELVRGGRKLHPEIGHFIVNASDRTLRCACGNFGCAESYLSGSNFSNRFKKIYSVNKPMDAKIISAMARQGNRKAKQAFSEYAEIFAATIHNYVVAYYPEIVIITGSFAESSDLFLNAAKEHLKSLLKRKRKKIDLMPKFSLSALRNRATLLGGAYIALR